RFYKSARAVLMRSGKYEAAEEEKKRSDIRKKLKEAEDTSLQHELEELFEYKMDGAR
ncbi:Hypothetical protein FKW44_009729, partial [Caligus rogercresseyi]